MTLAPAAARRANGNRGGNRARVQAAASYGKTDLPAPEPTEGDPRREMFRWFEEAFVGVRSDLQTLIASMTHQQAMLAELIDSRQAELRLVLAAETLPDIVADAVASAVDAHTEAMTESFSTALGAFREEMDKAQAGTNATVDNLRETFDTFLNALAVHDEGAEKREAARLRTLKGSITRQMAPLAEAVAMLTAQAESGRPARRQPAAARPQPQPEPEDDDDEPVVKRPAAAGARPARPGRVVTGSQVAQPRAPRVVTGPQVKSGQAKPAAAASLSVAPGGHRPRRREIDVVAGSGQAGVDSGPDGCGQADPQDGGRPVAPASHDPQLPRQALTSLSRGRRRFRQDNLPSRSSLGVTPVQSTTVDGLPVQLPASSTTGTASPKAAATSAAVVSDSSPWRLALVVASGPTARHRARGTAWAGHRNPIVSSSSPRSAPSFGRAGSTTVSGPGQKRSIRVRAHSGTAVVRARACSSPATSTGRLTSRGRRLASKMRSVAVGTNGSAARP